MEGMNDDKMVLRLPSFPPSSENGGNEGEAAATEAVVPVSGVCGSGPNTDDPKLKRKMACRVYSQRHRTKKAQYIAKLETDIKSLKDEVETNSNKISCIDQENLELRVDHYIMKQKLFVVSSELQLKEDEYADLKKEKDSMKESFMHG